MKLLILGGTRFVGRHLVDAALARGDAVTVFTRGRQPNPWGAAVTALTGNRNPEVAPGLAALEQGTWDAVIDVSGYVPRIVRASAALLAPRVGRYLFVSSFSVYAD
jgi:2'-hydroxyisoflavone reductase